MWKDYNKRAYKLFLQNRWQIIIGFNVTVGILALTFYQRYMGMHKQRNPYMHVNNLDLYNTAPTPIADANRQEQERLAVQILVNERRQLKGLPPYKYSSIVEHPNADSIFQDIELHYLHNKENK